jgi:hypothetical protein
VTPISGGSEDVIPKHYLQAALHEEMKEQLKLQGKLSPRNNCSTFTTICSQSSQQKPCHYSDCYMESTHNSTPNRYSEKTNYTAMVSTDMFGFSKWITQIVAVYMLPYLFLPFSKWNTLSTAGRDHGMRPCLMRPGL